MEKILKRDFLQALEADKSIIKGLTSPTDSNEYSDARNRLSVLVNKPVQFIDVHLESIVRL